VKENLRVEAGDPIGPQRKYGKVSCDLVPRRFQLKKFCGYAPIGDTELNPLAAAFGRHRRKKSVSRKSAANFFGQPSAEKIVASRKYSAHQTKKTV
jgi:hypothetical protein